MIIVLIGYLADPYLPCVLEHAFTQGGKVCPRMKNLDPSLSVLKVAELDAPPKVDCF